MNTPTRIAICASLALTLLGAGRARAGDLRRLVREGNRAFAAEDYETALEKYRSAQVEAPESPHLYFNIANALLKQGKHEEATENFLKVHSRQQPSLGAWAFYNVGVGQYRQAEEAIGIQDYQKALELLKQCMASNRQAMKIDPYDEDPKFNYEQALRKYKEVLDAIKKQQEEQKKQQDQQNEQQQDGQQDQQDQNLDQQKKDKEQQEKGEKQKKEQQQTGDRKDQKDQPDDNRSSETQQARPRPQPKVGEMTPEDARRLLNSLDEQQKQDLQRFLMRQVPQGYRLDKDW